MLFQTPFDAFNTLGITTWPETFDVLEAIASNIPIQHKTVSRMKWRVVDYFIFKW